MGRPSRAAARRRTTARPGPTSRQPRHQLVRIDVTVVLPRRLGWLLAGITIGNLQLSQGLLEKATVILRGLMPG